MRQKGISDIITIIILLLVAVSLAGAFFIWAGRTTTTMTESAGAQINQTSQALGQRVRIDSASGTTFVLRNIGSSQVSPNTTALFVNGAVTSFVCQKSPIPVGEFAICTLSAACPVGNSIKASTPGGESLAETCN